MLDLYALIMGRLRGGYLTIMPVPYDDPCGADRAAYEEDA